jgi:hypothetical protein
VNKRQEHFDAEIIELAQILFFVVERITLSIEEVKFV